VTQEIDAKTVSKEGKQETFLVALRTNVSAKKRIGTGTRNRNVVKMALWRTMNGNTDQGAAMTKIGMDGL
jgi:hypothetical protein